jgi:hypothetical protein
MIRRERLDTVVNWHKAQMVEQKKKMAKLAKKHITQLITEAYRRPATNHEISKISSLFEKTKITKGTQAAARLILIRVFCSPNFLFKIEKTQNAPRPYKISSHELAVRLSYFLWSSSPDQELLQLAQSNELQKRAILDKQVIRMLKNPKAKSLAENFAAQWLQFKEIAETVDLDKKRFPEFTKELSKDMFTECVETINYIIQSDSSILQVIDSNYIFANENIARLYGIHNIKGELFRKITLKDKARGGIVTTPAIMAMTSYPLRTSPILRGNWVISALLGTPTPPPPSNVEELPEDDSVNDGLSIKQRFEKHRKDPTCYSCHSRLDPMGFPLELFDPLGKLRQKAGGHPVDATGTLKDGSILNGPIGLKQHLLSKRQLFLSNLASKALGYALGRSLEFFDQYTVKKAVEQMTKNKYQFSALIKTIVHSKAIQYRRGHDHLGQ